MALPFEPIILKRLIIDLGLNQAEMGRIAGVHRSTFNVCVNRGYIPTVPANFKTKVEQYLQMPKAQAWLKENNLSMSDIWTTEGTMMRSVRPKGWRNNRPAMMPGNPEEIETHKEVEMLQEGAMKHFKLFRNPFLTRSVILRIFTCPMSIGTSRRL